MKVSWMKLSAALAASGLAIGVAAGSALSAGGSDGFVAASKKGAKKAITGDITPVTPPDKVVELVEKLNTEVANMVEDGDEPGDMVGRLSVVREMAKLLTVRTEADIKAWGEKVVAAYAKVDLENPDKKDIEEAVKTGKALVAEGKKNAAKWASSKAVKVKYTTANPTLAHLMSYVGAAHSKIRGAIGQPGINLQKAQVPSAWALAEIGNLSELYGPQEDWKKWSREQRDNYAEVAKKLSAGDPNTARKFFDAAQGNCKACHDKYQSEAPVGN